MMVSPSQILDLRALVVELVDTRDLKSLGVRAVPVQVRPGAPSNFTCDTSSVGRAQPCQG